MKSTIVKGKVFHERFHPVSHWFSYPVCLYCLDLAELEELDRSLPGFSYNRFGVSAIHDRDYLDDRPGSIRERLFSFLHQAGAASGIDRVMLLTAPRFIFRVFNPVSQREKFDPDRTYVDRWIAEGQRAPAPQALSYFDAVPRTWGLSPAQPYPDPVVGADTGRRRALDAYAARGDAAGRV